MALHPEKACSVLVGALRGSLSHGEAAGGRLEPGQAVPPSADDSGSPRAGRTEGPVGL